MRPKVTFGAVANIFTRLMNFEKAGDEMQGHYHTYDHLTLLASGSVKVIVDEQETTFTAPHMIYIRADKKHTLIALEDKTVACCIHAIRDKDTGDIVEPNMIPNGVSHRGHYVPYANKESDIEEI